MQAFLDTSVLVAVFYAQHEHHEASINLFVRMKKESACTAAHCLAELYSVLTGMPGKNKASPDEAMLFINDVKERLTIIALSSEEYYAALSDAASAGITGGTMYDSLLASCALKAGVKILYTWNLKHFRRLGHAAISVETPSS